jgi:plasmid maintenance system antidote protein VapI
MAYNSHICATNGTKPTKNNRYMTEIKKQMKLKGISPKLMSELTGVHRNTIYNHINGRKKCTQRQLDKYNKVLKLS